MGRLIRKLLVLLFCLPVAAGFCKSGEVFLPPDLAEPNAVVEPVMTGLGNCEGPAVDSEGNLFFSEVGKPGKIWKVPHQGKPTVFNPNSNRSNGLEFDSLGRLVACEQDRVVRYEKDGSKTVLAKKYGDKEARTNDLSIGLKGDFYFTHPIKRGLGRVFFVKADGTIKEVATGLKHPNGIKWVEEKSILYVAFSTEDKILKYDVAPDGSIENPKIFAQLTGPDGFTMDENFNLYAASHTDHTVYVYDPNGQNLGKIVVDAPRVSNCTFGGPEGKTLYMTGRGGVWKLRLKIAGRSR